MHVCEPSRDLRRHLEKEYEFKGGKMKGTGSMASMKDAGGGGGFRGGGGRDRDRERGFGGGGGGGGRDRDRDGYRR